jgi:hypothetical protein
MRTPDEKTRHIYVAPITSLLTQAPESWESNDYVGEGLLKFVEHVEHPDSACK